MKRVDNVAEKAASVKGLYYDGRTSGAHACTLSIDAQGNLTLQSESSGIDPTSVSDVRFAQLEVSSRIGNTPRYLRFPDGASVETLDNDEIDHWQRRFTPSFITGLAHYLESQKRYMIGSVVAVLIALFVFFNYVIPAASKWLAYQLPPAVAERSGERILAFLDDKVFAESRLSDQRREKLQSDFQHYFADKMDKPGLKLHFRASESIGANAIALPSGDLVFTDALVELAGDDRELLAIMAHEVGHIYHRHATRRLIQDSFFLVAITLVTGDVSGMSSALVVAPVMMVEMAYSRQFENEADNYALSFMQGVQLDPVHFSNIMQRLQWLDEGRCDELEEASATVDESQRHWQDVAETARDFLSSHPVMSERIEGFGKPDIVFNAAELCGKVEVDAGQ